MNTKRSYVKITLLTLFLLIGVGVWQYEWFYRIYLYYALIRSLENPEILQYEPRIEQIEAMPNSSLPRMKIGPTQFLCPIKDIEEIEAGNSMLHIQGDDINMSIQRPLFFDGTKLIREEAMEVGQLYFIRWGWMFGGEPDIIKRYEKSMMAHYANNVYLWLKDSLKTQPKSLFSLLWMSPEQYALHTALLKHKVGLLGEADDYILLEGQGRKYVIALKEFDGRIRAYLPFWDEQQKLSQFLMMYYPDDCISEKMLFSIVHSFHYDMDILKEIMGAKCPEAEYWKRIVNELSGHDLFIIDSIFLFCAIDDYFFPADVIQKTLKKIQDVNVSDCFSVEYQSPPDVREKYPVRERNEIPYFQYLGVERNQEGKEFFRELTALHVAVCSHRLEIVDLLLKLGADVDAKAEYGESPLDMYYKPNGVDINAKENYDLTPLHMAVQKGYAEEARLLLDHGADTAATIGPDLTPLHVAAREGNAEMVRLLLEYHADPNAETSYGATPLKMAKTEAIIELLTDNK